MLWHWWKSEQGPSGAASTITVANARKITKGMTGKQVLGILGPPRIETNKIYPDLFWESTGEVPKFADWASDECAVQLCFGSGNDGAVAWDTDSVVSVLVSEKSLPKPPFWQWLREKLPW